MSKEQDFTDDFDITSNPQIKSKGKFRLSAVSDLLISLGDIDNEYKIEYHKSDDKWWIIHTEVGSGEPLEQWLTNRAIVNNR